MQAVLQSICDQLNSIIVKLNTLIPNDEPFGIAQSNWSFPGLTRVEMVDEAQTLISLITDHGTDDVGAAEPRLKDYIRRLEYLSSATIPQMWGNANAAVSAYLFTLSGLRKILEGALKPNPQQETMLSLRRLQTQLRGMESRLRDLDPRTTALKEMVERIELAYNAADQLPADLETLEEARARIRELEKEATKDQARLFSIREAAEQFEIHLKAQSDEAATVLGKCESAYSASTSVGLSAAFSERSKDLDRSMTFWIVTLIVALIAGGIVGALRLHTLSELMMLPSALPSAVTMNLLLSVISVGAPIWFAWLATKQIGQRFRLSEDYAFKASISRAYEGFRREAARHGTDMEARVLTSALNRLDELPLRFVENANHGSPLHEFATSESFKKAFDTIPGFADRIKSYVREALVVPQKFNDTPDGTTIKISKNASDGSE